jgi:hypothetical protein
LQNDTCYFKKGDLINAWDQVEKILYRYVEKKLEDTSSNITSIFENGRWVFILNTYSK